MKKLFTILTICLLAACSPKAKLDGTYVGFDKTRSITFQSNGKVFETNSKTKFPEASYNLEGNVIKIDGQLYQLKLMDDGSIDGGAAYGMMTKK